MVQQSSGKIKVSFGQAMGLIGPYLKERFMAQIKSVWLIITYLVLFQTIILDIPIFDAAIISVGISLVVVGLSFFMEGLFLGLMPLGELVGVKLPQKSNLVVILLFALVLGFLATLAEPAIAVLQSAGAGVKPWDAPLLFLILTKHSSILVYSVGTGVGIAVLFGMLRFIYNWSLKPFIYVLVGLLGGFTIFSLFEPNLMAITGLAWDCGAVTTGPVTVPLVLALGIGISRMVGGDDSNGFGVVTLASLFPILTVFLLGLFFLNDVPSPMSESEFFAKKNRVTALQLFSSEKELQTYALNKTGKEGLSTFVKSEGGFLNFATSLKQDESKREKYFETKQGFSDWVIINGTSEQIQKIYLNETVPKRSEKKEEKTFSVFDVLKRNSIAAITAIGLLTLPLFFTLFIVLREKLPRIDEIFLGLFFAILGMGIFSIGIELGLNRLGGQLGQKLPSAFTAIPLEEQKVKIANFTPDNVERAMTEDGTEYNFFNVKKGKEIVPIQYDKSNYNAVSKTYEFTPKHGPLFGKTENSLAGILVVILFAFIMGYGATLAEPALNALGLTVEELTVGTFKKSLLMQAVALGVGVGIAIGVARIIYNIPLAYLLIPPYILLFVITMLSTEEFVNIGWDSAGVTTGPITVPLVLSMGLGIGSQVGVIEGFGILAMASVCPILSVLSVGLYVTRKRKAALREDTAEAKGAA